MTSPELHLLSTRVQNIILELIIMIGHRHHFALLFLIFFSFNLFGQELDLTLPIYKIEINQEYLDQLNANPSEDSYFPATFDYDTIRYSCEVRYRGSTGRELPKKSWKIRFKDNQTIFEAEKLNLNAEYRDQSLMRNYLIMKLYKFLGYQASEVNFVSLYVNNEYKGVYVQTEQVDENFLERNAIESGDLFKGVQHGANMSPLVNYENYLTRWEPKISDQDSYSKLQELFCKFYYWTPEDFNDKVSHEVNVDNIINYFALEFCISSTDCFTKNMYLNYNLGTERYELFPWDNDGSLGNKYTGEFLPELISTTYFPKLSNHILYRRLLENPVWQDEYSNAVNVIISDGFSYLKNMVDSIYGIIKNDYYLDPEKGCSNDDFESDIQNLHQFLDGRSILLAGYAPNKVNRLFDADISDGLIFPSDSIVKINIKSESPQRVYFKYVLDLDPSIWHDQYNLMTLELYDDGLHSDNLAGDLIYGNLLKTSDLPKENIPAYFKSGENLDYPYNGIFHINIQANRTISYTLNNTNNSDITKFLEIKEIFVYGDKYCIEIANNSSENADISFCFLQSGDYYNIFPIPDGTIISPFESIIISSDISFSKSYFPSLSSIGNCFFDIKSNNTMKLLSPTLKEIISISIDPTYIDHKPERIVINEINYNSDQFFDTEDWVELFNPNEFGVDISGWVFKDSQQDNSFTIPQEVIIPPKEYIVICNSFAEFSSKQPTINNIIGDFDFNLSGSGDMVLLYDNYDVLVDSVNYDDRNPWPEGADGFGATLELKNPKLDNSLAENWEASENHGSPGKINSNYNGTNLDTLAPIQFKTYPNPFSSFTILSFNLNETNHIDFSIYDSKGNLIEKVFSSILPKGQHSVKWKPEGLNSGFYFAILKIGNSQVYHNRIVYLKQ